jgi:hypothetical protein
MTDYNEKTHPLIDRDGSVGKSIENIAINKIGGPDTIRKTFIDEGSTRTRVHTRGEGAQPEVKVSKGKKSKVWAWPWHGVTYHNGAGYVTETSSGTYPTRGVSPASVHPHHSVLLTAVPDGLEPALIPEPATNTEGAVWVNYATVSNGILFGEDVGLGSWIWTDNDIAYLVKSTINGTTSVSLEIHLLSEWVAGMSSSAAADFVEYNAKDFKSPYMFKAPPSGAARTPVANLTVNLPALYRSTPSVVMVYNGDCSFNGSKSIFTYTIGMPDDEVAMSNVEYPYESFVANEFGGMTSTYHVACQWAELSLINTAGVITGSFTVIQAGSDLTYVAQYWQRVMSIAYKGNDANTIRVKMRYNAAWLPYASYTEGTVYTNDANIKHTVRRFDLDGTIACGNYGFTNEVATQVSEGENGMVVYDNSYDEYRKVAASTSTFGYEPVWMNWYARIAPPRTRSSEKGGSVEYAPFDLAPLDARIWDVGMVQGNTPGKYFRNVAVRADGYGLATLCALGGHAVDSSAFSPSIASLYDRDFLVNTLCAHITPYGAFYVEAPSDKPITVTISFSPTDISSGTPQPGIVYGIPPDATTIKPKRFV